MMTPEWLTWLAPLLLVVGLLLAVRISAWLKGTTVLLIGATAAVCAWQLNGRLARQAVSAQQLADRTPSEGRPGGYLSSDKCESCHPSQYDSWHHSYHRTMTQLASPRSVLGRFDNVTLELDGKSYFLQRRGDEYWVHMEDPEWEAALAAGAIRAAKGPAPRVWKRVGLLTGSHHMQAYWVPSSMGKQQIIFPFAWLNDDQRWVPFHQTFLRDPAQPPSMHVWNANCINCHATAGQPRVDPETHLMSTRAGELGIACEACHGPGQAHVAANRNLIRRYLLHWRKQADPTIINPKRLPARLSSEICGQCHGIKWITDSADWRVNGFRYRPGDELDNTSPLVRPTRLKAQPWLKEPLARNPAFLDDHYWSDGMVRVSGRDFSGLVEAPCHQRGTLACVSCHSLHESNPANQLAKGMDSNEACFQCHGSMRNKLPQHTHHPPNSSGSNCYNCHMPHTVYGLLKAIRSHQIDSPTVQATLATGRPNACNLCHLDRSLGWTSKYLSEWYGQPQPSLTDDQQHISAAVLGALQGDAGIRALYAYSMGWEDARRASGEQWLVPCLAILLDDPYSAVRYIAYRSLRNLSNASVASTSYDFIAPAAARHRAAQNILDGWSKGKTTDRTGPEILLKPDCELYQEKVLQLLEHRDNRSMDLQE
jgi:predicted CXXCH cytochrome family protein